MNQSKMRSVACLAAGLSLLGASAGAADTPTYYLSKNMTGGADFYAVSYWADADGNPPAESGSIPANADYVVKDGRQIFINSSSSGGKLSFYPQSLRLGDSASGQDGKIWYDWASGNSYGFTKLIVERGRFCVNNWQNEVNTTGPIEVRATAETPFVFTHGDYVANRTWQIKGTLTGEPGTGVKFTALARSSNSYNDVIKLTGDCSGYRGAVVAEMPAGTLDGKGLTLVVPPSLAAGTVTVKAGVYLQVSSGASALEVGSLELADGARLIVPIDGAQTNGGVRVKTAFVKGTGKLDLKISVTGQLAVSHRVLTVPESCALTAADIAVTFADDVPAYVKQLWSFVEEDPVDGYKSFVLRLSDTGSLVYQTSSDYYDKDKSYSSSMTDASHWSDKLVPHEGAHYMLVGKCLRTQSDSTLNLKFPGYSLQLVNGSQLSLLCRDFSVPLINSTGNNSILAGLNQWPVLSAAIVNVNPGRLDLKASYGYNVIIYSKFTGEGDLAISGTDYSSGDPSAVIKLHGDNSGFHGGILLTNVMSSASFEGYHQAVDVIDPSGLGGTCAAFNPRALELTKGGVLKLSFGGGVQRTTPFVLDAASNRGLFVHGDGGITAAWEVPSTVINWPITYDGALHLSGYGASWAFSLGGVPKFAGADGEPCDTPTAGKNVLAVDKATVRPTAAHALDGVTVRFAANGRMTLPMSRTDGEFAAKGICNTKTDVPFVLASGESTLPRTLDWTGLERPEETLRLGLLTVSAAVADSVESMLPSIASPFKGLRVRTVRQANDDGSVTFAAEIYRNGLLLILK